MGRGPSREAVGRRVTAVHAACRAGLDCRLGPRHGEERTWNMPCMVVTLEVSKLSGWLNAFASCRESKEGHAVRFEMWPGWREAAGDRGARSVQRRARLQIGGRARGGAHVEHGVHGRDAGGVEAQRLVERRRILPRVETRAYGAVRFGPGGREAADDSGARSVAGQARLQIRGGARGRAHEEHVVHVSDAGGIEAQRLVERRRALPRVERRAYAAGRGAPGGRRAACDRGASAACRGEGSTADWEQGTGRSEVVRGARYQSVESMNEETFKNDYIGYHTKLSLQAQAAGPL